MITDRAVPRHALAIGIFALGAALIMCGREIATHQLFTSAIAGADAVLERAIPRVGRLSSLRSKVHAIEALVKRMDEARTPDERARIGREIEDILAVIESERAAYENAPAPIDEREKQAELRSRIAAVRRSATDFALMTEQTEASRTDEAVLLAVNEVEREVEALIVLNVDAAHGVTAEITDRQQALRRISLVLCGCVLALVTFGGWITWRWIERADRETALRMAELDAFAARAAHDLKGPLSPAVMSLSLLARSPSLDAPGRRAVETIRRSHERLLAIIDGLLAFSRAATATRDRGEEASVDEVLADLVLALRTLARDEEARLKFEVEPSLHVAVSKVVLGSILDNLIRNAILHLDDSRQRSVTVRARSDGPVAAISVADTGPGIAPDLLARLFHPFVRGSGRPGSGLGLAIVKRLADAHGGDVTVFSQVGRGSKFTVRLPLASPPADASVTRRAA